MQINNETYYHIHRPNEWDNDWKIGNRIHFKNGIPNSFLKFYEDHEPRYSINSIGHSPKIAAKEMKRLLRFWGPQDFANYLDFSLNVFKECGMYIREQIFEEERVKKDQSLPSRKSCIWVFKEEARDYWINTLGVEHQCYEVKLTGEIYTADQVHLYDEIVKHESIRTNACEYWAGASGNNPKEEECLFVGEVYINKAL